MQINNIIWLRPPRTSVPTYDICINFEQICEKHLTRGDFCSIL